MDRVFFTALDFWQRFTFTRYLVASAVALAFDVAVFASLIALYGDPTIASAIGYIAGIVIHWTVSANMVFPRKTMDGGGLHIQRALFAGSALVGLAITMLTVELLGRGGVHPIMAKSVAISISFVAVYAMRKWGVFK